MKKILYKLKGKVWLWGYDAVSPWHFVSVSKKETAQIRKDFAKVSKGFQSLPVSVKIGKTEWKTSIFFDSRSQSYLLPLKSQVRKKEGIMKDDDVVFVIKIIT